MRVTRLLGCASAVATFAWGSGAFADVTVAVDAGANAHPISPLIYGINFPTTAQLATNAVTVMRRGGNATSRYNYQIDFHNTGQDYFFENVPDCQGCADPQDNSSANAFLQQAASSGVVALFTMPTIGVMPKPGSPQDHPYACAFSVRTYANQLCFDPYDTNCGDGTTNGSCAKPAGPYLTGNDPSLTSTAADANFEKGWAAYLVSKFGPANGKRIYELDNEPALWSSTHHDVRPQHLGYDELWQRMSEYAAAIAQADPTAQFAGPVEWGWPNYLCSDVDTAAGPCAATSPDRAAHGGEELAAWLLDQAKAYEQQNGSRILHYLDLHYYPQGGNVPDNTRSLWDPTYTDPSWINANIQLIPRMRNWVSGHYPGTKISVSEYDFGSHDDPIGAVTYAEVLGIFGREGLDMATAYSPPAATERAFSAFKLFRNYDGNGGHFESTSVSASVNGTGVQAFAASSATRLTIVLANEGAATSNATISLAGFSPGATASVYSNDGTANISKKADAAVSNDKISVALAATTITLLVVDGANSNPIPDAGTSAGGNTSSGGGSTAGTGGNGNGGTSNVGGTANAAGGASTGASGTTNGAGGSASGSGASTSAAGTNTSGLDASTSSSSAESKGGCGCRTASRTSSNPEGPALLALVLGLARRKRRSTSIPRAS